jgi:putative phosphoribosyl transferase
MNRVTDFLHSTRRPYSDRANAGRAVAAALQAEFAGRHDVVVLGLARGGVPVAAEVAAVLGAQLDVTVVRKLGVPGHEELAFGAITERFMVVNDSVIKSQRITEPQRERTLGRERRELARRLALYREGRPVPTLTGRTVILVDDGIATGASMRVAALDANGAGAALVIVAVPTAPAAAQSELADVADRFVCPHSPKHFVAVGMSYADFTQVEDDEVRAALHGRG